MLLSEKDYHYQYSWKGENPFRGLLLFMEWREPSLGDYSLFTGKGESPLQGLSMDTRNSESVKDFEKGSSMRKAPSTEWPLNITTHACKQFTDTHSCAQQPHVHGL
jgi:hypothetical protein